MKSRIDFGLKQTKKHTHSNKNFNFKVICLKQETTHLGYNAQRELLLLKYSVLFLGFC